MLAKFSGVESERTVSKFRKRQRNVLCCVHLLCKAGMWKFHVAVVQWWLKNVQKSVICVQSCCFTNIKLLLFLLFLLLSPSLLPKLPFVVIQKCCYHGNVTSHFSSLLISNYLLNLLQFLQHAKKVVSDSPGLVDFAIRLVNSVINLPNGEVIFFEEFK